MEAAKIDYSVPGGSSGSWWVRLQWRWWRRWRRGKRGLMELSRVTVLYVCTADWDTMRNVQSRVFLRCRQKDSESKH